MIFCSWVILVISVPPPGGSRSQLRVRTAPRPPAPFRKPTTDVRLSSSYYILTAAVRLPVPFFRTRHLPAHLGDGLVLAQSFMDHPPQQIVTGQGDILHLHDKFGPHPMHAA